MILDAQKRLCQLALISTLLLSLLSYRVSAQGSNIGQEVVVTYSGTTAQLAPPNTPAINFAGGGTNTFILSVGSTVSVRVYLTNDTANSCSGFSIQMFAATDAQTNSFNNALQNWQTVPLQSPAGTGGLVPAVTGLTLPPNAAIYVTSAAIQAPKVTIQILGSGGCTTTTMEAVAYVSPVSVTSPLVSTATAGTSGATANVQGAYAQNYNGNAINPVMIGGQGLPINTSFTGQGLDCINQFGFTLTTGTGFFTVGSIPCVTQGTNELAIALEVTTGSPGGSSVNSPPWSCNWPSGPGNSCSPGGSTIVAEQMTPAVAGTPLIRQYIGSLGIPAGVGSVIMTFKGGQGRQHRQGGLNSGLFAASLAGSVIIESYLCNVLPPCGVTISSSLGLTYKNVAILPFTGPPAGSLYVNMSTSANPGGFENVTISGTTGNVLQQDVMELSNPVTSSLVNPTTIAQTDMTGRIVTAPDAQNPNLWTCSVTLTTNTTTLCEGLATTINTQAVRPYVTDYTINTTTAGTATTIQLVTGTGSNCATGLLPLSAITYPNTAIAITNVGPFHTPLIGQLQSEVCVTQAGTTAGTSVVEIHGFWAP